METKREMSLQWVVSEEVNLVSFKCVWRGGGAAAGERAVSGKRFIISCSL